jgi:UDP-3-O-[3-hydroxymyristoyl] N-acetylglucosamine deacetylase
VAPASLKAGVDMNVQRKTISTPVSISGIGLHSGIYTTVTLKPAAPGGGITFVRADLDGLRIPALQASTTALDYATTVGKDDVSVGTVEHLLSALMASGITDVDIHIDGPEVPIVDGSALPFMHLIDAAGVRSLGSEVPLLRLREPIEVVDGEKFIRMTPSNRLVLKYKIDFDHPVIGKQALQFDYDHDNFLRKIAPARTFGFVRDVEKMRAAGLARGGSVENCIVLGDDDVMNGPLRFRDEFVRHKILDLLGDLALIGRPIAGEITASRAGHALHSRFVAKVLAAAARADEDLSEAAPTEPAFA